ncbi:hypothetical protein SAMN04487897_104150 [Paenibacillus sp. yr247]|nr:hypothetical protein [Paenibacillus sp. yr247]SDN70657.1 hypothetical protein SAMN04487897_104150 [Paenibacillus sp. yr247]
MKRLLYFQATFLSSGTVLILLQCVVTLSTPGDVEYNLQDETLKAE